MELPCTMFLGYRCSTSIIICEWECISKFHWNSFISFFVGYRELCSKYRVRVGDLALIKNIWSLWIERYWSSNLTFREGSLFFFSIVWIDVIKCFLLTQNWFMIGKERWLLLIYKKKKGFYWFSLWKNIFIFFLINCNGFFNNLRLQKNINYFK